MKHSTVAPYRAGEYIWWSSCPQWIVAVCFRHGSWPPWTSGYCTYGPWSQRSACPPADITAILSSGRWKLSPGTGSHLHWWDHSCGSWPEVVHLHLCQRAEGLLIHIPWAGSTLFQRLPQTTLQHRGQEISWDIRRVVSSFGETIQWGVHYSRTIFYTYLRITSLLLITSILLNTTHCGTM